MTESSRHIIHEIYSDVMFELAGETGRIDEVMNDLHAVAQVLRQEPEFLTLLMSPKLKEEEKVKMIRRVFSGRVNPLTLDFLSVLARRNRAGFISGIAGRYEDLYDAMHNRKRIEVTLAKEPTAEQIETLKAELREAIAAEVKLTVKVDPEIIGGIIIRKGDKVIDNSVKSILDRSVKTIMNYSREKAEREEKKKP
jgi:F-type H+-transporting ATPase subunit delta